MYWKRKWVLVWLCGSSREVLELQVATASLTILAFYALFNPFLWVSCYGEIAQSAIPPQFYTSDKFFLANFLLGILKPPDLNFTSAEQFSSMLKYDDAFWLHGMRWVRLRFMVVLELIFLPHKLQVSRYSIPPGVFLLTLSMDKFAPTSRFQRNNCGETKQLNFTFLKIFFVVYYISESKKVHQQNL